MPIDIPEEFILPGVEVDSVPKSELTEEERLLQKQRALTYIETARKHASEPAVPGP